MKSALTRKYDEDAYWRPKDQLEWKYGHAIAIGAGLVGLSGEGPTKVYSESDVEILFEKDVKAWWEDVKRACGSY